MTATDDNCGYYIVPIERTKGSKIVGFIAILKSSVSKDY